MTSRQEDTLVPCAVTPVRLGVVLLAVGLMKMLRSHPVTAGSGGGGTLMAVMERRQSVW